MAKATELTKDASRVGHQLSVLTSYLFSSGWMLHGLWRRRQGRRRNNVSAFPLCLVTFPIISIKDYEPTLQRKKLRLSKVA